MHDLSIKLLIVEDSPEQSAILHSYIETVPNVEIVHTVSRGKDYIDTMTRNREINAVLLDEQLADDMRGLEAYTILQFRGRKAATVLMTGRVPMASYTDDLDIIDTLEKPFTLERLQGSIRKLRNHLNYERFIASGGFYVPLFSDNIMQLTPGEILFIESLNRTIYVHTVGASYETKIPLRQYEQYLQDRHFVMSHRSCLVNLTQVERVEEHAIGFINSAHTAVIADDKVEEFRKYWAAYKKRKLRQDFHLV